MLWSRDGGCRTEVVRDLPFQRFQCVVLCAIFAVNEAERIADKDDPVHERAEQLYNAVTRKASGETGRKGMTQRERVDSEVSPSIAHYICPRYSRAASSAGNLTLWKQKESW